MPLEHYYRFSAVLALLNFFQLLDPYGVLCAHGGANRFEW